MAPRIPAQTSNLHVDYVIIYRFRNSDPATAASTFTKLLEKLAEVGLATEVRNGEDESLLIFVKLASDEYLQAEVYRSRVQDWLHGVRSAAPDKETINSLKDEPLYPAERLRILYQMLTNPVAAGGAGITPQHGEWTNVEAIFALHDHTFNKTWLKKWATTYMLKVEDLDEIRNLFGEKIAFYFAFTQSYFTALIGIATFGFSAWLILGYFSPVYAVVNGLLCVAFVEYWKHEQEDLAIRWGVRGVSAIEHKRNDFVPEKEMSDPVTGEKTLYFPAPKRLQRQLLQIPFALAAALVLGTLIATCFGIEIFISEIYKGPGQSLLVFLPTGIITTMQPLLLGFLTSLANRLTKYENYPTDAAYDYAITQKLFVLNFITSYTPILLTAFIYIPFAKTLVPYLDVFSLTVRPFAEHEGQLQAPSGSNFEINPSRLRKQVIYFTVTAQIVNQALEVVLPYIKRRGTSKFKEIQTSRAAKRGGAVPAVSDTDTAEEADFLKRVRTEASLEIYDVTADFREMIVQYGYLALFSAVWPATGVSFLVNNWLELRTDAIKICVESRRPTPWRAESIGPWLDSLGFLTWLGSLTSAALVYLFRGGDDTKGNLSAASLWGLLLSIFFAEHAYFLVQMAVKTFISKLDSPSRQKLRAERFAVRKRYIEETLGSKSLTAKATQRDKEAAEITRRSLEDEARQDSVHDATPETRFWRRQRGWRESARFGASLISRYSSSSEGKKER